MKARNTLHRNMGIEIARQRYNRFWDMEFDFEDCTRQEIINAIEKEKHLKNSSLTKEDAIELILECPNVCKHLLNNYDITEEDIRK